MKGQKRSHDDHTPLYGRAAGDRGCGSGAPPGLKVGEEGVPL